MEQLSGLDAAFVRQDSSRTPMHVSAVLLYGADAAGEHPLGRAQLLALARERLAPFPLFRRKLRRVALDMDTPYWVDVHRPDWSGHISEHRLPGPRGWVEFIRLLNRLHAGRMDLTRPLWEMHLVHDLRDAPGLPPHCQALVLKVHHAAIDGSSLAVIIDALHRETAAGGRVESRASRPLTPWDLWTRLQRNVVSRQFKLAETVSNLLPGLQRVRRSQAEFADLPPVQRRGARFNARVSGRRNTGAVIWPLADAVAIRRAVRHVTLNDIALSVVAGALRRYLQRRGQLPTRSLSAGVPVNLRRPGEHHTGGNRTATMTVGLATQVADPVERLRLVHRYAIAGKRQLDALGSGTIMDISDSLAPAVLSESIRTMALASTVADAPVPFHTIVSNVPGPRETLTLAGAPLLVPLGLGPVRDNMGLFHIVSSAAERMSVAFNACAGLLPDAAYYEECLAESFAALRREALVD